MPTNEIHTVPPKAGVKLSKTDAGYVDKGPFGCRFCTWFEGKGTGMGDCDVVGGQVSGNGCCDFWNDQKAPKGVGKDKTEYVYYPPYKYTCSLCKFFDAKTNTCTPVTGTISAGASCNKWMPEAKVSEADVNITFSAEVMFPGLSSTIREAASSGVREANPMTAPGGRIPRTDPDTLAKINAPCATCGHSYLSHILESKQCFHCKPKGSNHRYHETPDLSPNLVQPPTLSGTASGQPENGITGLMRTSRVAETASLEADYEGAAERLMETIFSSAFPDVESNKAMADGDKALTLYNAHSTAAHRSSTMAYSGGGNNSAMHQVAAAHHQLAAEAANTAAGKVKSDKTKKDLATAAKYHSAQSGAHKAAAATQDSGNRQPYSYESSGNY